MSQADPGEVQFRVRRATRGDLDALVLLEQSFPGDRMSKAGLSRLLASDSVEVWVADLNGDVIGDAIVLFRRGFDTARLYSMVVNPDFRERGVATSMLQAAEQAARERGAAVMRMEVRDENSAALALYQHAGYSITGRTDDYYQDATPALRLVKRFVSGGATVRAVPYHCQSFSFTSGAAGLMMAMHFHGYPAPLDQWLELSIWREATASFKQQGHGGLCPLGLAAVALRRGFQARVVMGQVPDNVIVPGDDESAEVESLARSGFERELRSLGGKVEIREVNADYVAEEITGGAIALVLLGGGERGDQVGRWMVVTGFDEEHIIMHDPCLPEGGAKADNIHLALRRDVFDSQHSGGATGVTPFVVLVERWGSLSHRSTEA